MHGLYWLSVNLADRKPLLLTVDDLQWVDRPLSWLGYLGPRTAESPMLVVPTVRAGDSGGQAKPVAPAPAVTGPLRWQASLPGRPGRGCAQLVSAARKLAAS